MTLTAALNTYTAKTQMTVCLVQLASSPTTSRFQAGRPGLQGAA